MASLRKQRGKWRAEVCRHKTRRSRVFPTRQEARDWAAREEALIVGGERLAGTTTLKDACQRYAREVSRQKRGGDREVIRLDRFCREHVASMRLSDIDARHLAEWRMKRLTEVAPATVRREMELLSSVFRQCVKEWGLLRANPLSDITRPDASPARDRRPSQDELDRLAETAGDLTTLTGRAHHAFLFAIETAMRAKEICGLRPESITGRVAHLPMTKNGKPRDVPLSSRALELWSEVPDGFGLAPSQLDSAFRRLCKQAGIKGLQFRDSRAEAATRLSKKLEPLELAKMMGHADLSMLIRVYYRESAADIAAKLG